MGHKLGCCEMCDTDDPHWEVVRYGDAVVTWSCDADLGRICERLQRDPEITRLSVEDYRKRKEWASISRTLERVVSDG